MNTCLHVQRFYSKDTRIEQSAISGNGFCSNYITVAAGFFCIFINAKLQTSRAEASSLASIEIDPPNTDGSKVFPNFGGKLERLMLKTIRKTFQQPKRTTLLHG